MSTNKTQNYQLHAWEKEDKFLMDEFNDNFAKLDDKIKAEARTAAQNLAALAAEMTGKGELVVGFFSASTTAPPAIDVGKPIKALFLENSSSYRGSALSDEHFYGGLILPSRNYRDGMVTITGSQFQISSLSDYYSAWTIYYLAWVESA